MTRSATCLVALENETADSSPEYETHRGLRGVAARDNRASPAFALCDRRVIRNRRHVREQLVKDFRVSIGPFNVERDR